MKTQPYKPLQSSLSELASPSTLYVYALDEDRCGDVQVAGGKGASLSVLLQQGFPVPGGLLIATDSYDAFLKPVLDKIEEMLSNWDWDAPGAATELSKRVQECLRTVRVPVALEKELERALCDLPAQQRFAVRSSSTLEDLSGAAFAGMHETFLNCHGLSRMVEAIRSCYLSLWSERAIAYRQHKGFHHLESRMAVVVQSMIECEVAGVGFSVHPVTGDLGTMVINSNFGLGESVVNGEHEVDHLELDKATGEVSGFLPGRKYSKIVCDSVAGGVREEALEASMVDSSCLTPWQIEQLSALMLRVEEAAQFPQDIEWGFSKGAVHLLQSRPITSIPPRWTRDESAERFPNVITPLSWDFVNDGFHKSLAYSLKMMGLPSFDGAWFASHDHYVYGNQNAVELYLGRAPFQINNLNELREAMPDLRQRYRWVQDLPVTWSRDLDQFLLGVGRLDSQAVEEWTEMGRIWSHTFCMESNENDHSPF
jgi:phosphoenolpyruvate synthase/pyruvate phosphate dikinase